MNESTPDATWMHSIDLAREPDFDLGSFRVRPARCKVEWDGRAEKLQRRVMQVLVALAQARGSVVSQDDLVSRCWRGLSVSEDAIYRCIGKLRKLAAEHADPPFAIEAVPGVGYRLTSAGGADNEDAFETPASSKGGVRFGASIAALVLLVLIAGGGVYWRFHDRAPDHQAIHVAVEPFEALTDSADARALARRMSNEIVNQLGDSQIQAVLEAEQTGKNVSRPTNPSAGLVVTGIVRDEERHTNINVRIEDSVTHEALWATQFTRGGRETSDLPLEVAARVADEINTVIFARGANPPLTDNSALSALLQVADMIRQGGTDTWAQELERAQAIVARHPEFPLGHDVLAYAYAEAARNVDVPARARAMSDAARREANLTLKLDPEDAGAYAILSELEPAYNYRAQEEMLLRGIMLARHPKAPLAGLYSAEGRLLDKVGRLRESLSLRLTAHAIDEWGAPKTAQLARSYANIGNLPAARDWIEKGFRLWPNHVGVRRARQYVAGFYEQPAAALKIFDSLDAQASPDESNVIWRGYVEARAAHSTKVTGEAIRRIRLAADHGIIPRETEIMMMGGLGEAKQAIDQANSALGHQRLDSWFLFTPITRNLRQHPGFLPLAFRMGLISYWRKTGKWPDLCTDPARRTECSPQLLAALKS
jgi:DNA-binding winged helix-turn-helix (wHTH) protein/TolB-like protein